MNRYRRISAHIVYTVTSRPLHQGIVTVDSDGTVISVDEWTPGKEDYNTEFYNGVIVPGFVNAHCHLELSHLHSLFDEDCGLDGFLEQMRNKRKMNSENAENSASLYDTKMYRDGISVVADIVNTETTLPVKNNSQIHYCNFIEVFGLQPQDADVIWERAILLKEKFPNSIIVPHALYSLSDRLRDYLADNNKRRELASIHYLESDSEELYYKNGKGVLAEKLATLAGYLPEFVGMGKHEALLSLFNKDANLLLVHNTFTDSSDVEAMDRLFPNHFRVLCPSSNYFISRRIPDPRIFSSEHVCLGTDSLASTHSLNMLDEMRLLINTHTGLTFEEVLTWATMNGSKALKLDGRYGSIEKGKKPGLVLIENFDFKIKGLRPESVSRRLL